MILIVLRRTHQIFWRIFLNLSLSGLVFFFFSFFLTVGLRLQALRKDRWSEVLFICYHYQRYMLSWLNTGYINFDHLAKVVFVTLLHWEVTLLTPLLLLLLLFEGKWPTEEVSIQTIHNSSARKICLLLSFFPRPLPSPSLPYLDQHELMDIYFIWGL